MTKKSIDLAAAEVEAIKGIVDDVNRQINGHLLNSKGGMIEVLGKKCDEERLTGAGRRQPDPILPNTPIESNNPENTYSPKPNEQNRWENTRDILFKLFYWMMQKYNT